jgi:O-antigen/teichoic acid export membrane protein
MITLVSSRVLGLYAVAVTLSGLASFATGALGLPLITRIAKGETALAARALRVTLCVITAMNLAIGAATPVVLPLLFGSGSEVLSTQRWCCWPRGYPLLASRC